MQIDLLVGINEQKNEDEIPRYKDFTPSFLIIFVKLYLTVRNSFLLHLSLKFIN
jgi:hypothetical protein